MKAYCFGNSKLSIGSLYRRVAASVVGIFDNVSNASSEVMAKNIGSRKIYLIQDLLCGRIDSPHLANKLQFEQRAYFRGLLFQQLFEKKVLMIQEIVNEPVLKYDLSMITTSIQFFQGIVFWTINSTSFQTIAASLNVFR
jgi:hypothetical protein